MRSAGKVQGAVSCHVNPGHLNIFGLGEENVSKLEYGGEASYSSYRSVGQMIYFRIRAVLQLHCCCIFLARIQTELSISSCSANCDE